MRAAAYRVLSALMPILGFFLTLWVIYNLETRFYPVITNWKLEYVERHGDAYRVGGVLTKTRACELLSTSVMAVTKDPGPRQLIYQLKAHEVLGGNAPTGTTTWGPWDMPIPAALLASRDKIDRLEIVGTHRCHALWQQETVYGSVSVETLP